MDTSYRNLFYSERQRPWLEEIFYQELSCEHKANHSQQSRAPIIASTSFPPSYNTTL